MSPADPASGSLPPAVIRALRCSICTEPVELNGNALQCSRRHSFDLAKQGYVNLLHAKVLAGTADTADMVAARAEFLAAGHYAPLAAELAVRAAERVRDGLVVDAGAGTGYYLARVLDELPDSSGLALDVSALALRRAARAHPRIGAAVWNLWQPWPVADDSASVLLNVFAPRNGAEFHRVLRPDGVLLVASPRPGHLAELASVVDLLAVDERKDERLDAALAGFFELTGRTECTRSLLLAPEDVRRVIRMGPSAHHLHRDGRRARLDALHEPVEVTASFQVSAFAPRRLKG
ncbi:putative RNA methyltransferase [Amycolatopsis nigrescens]|uniref:putative RNA methyltransferase n=1 Tax=Amycolatopsis nigrescens TaxID=381445 RepID=UPI0003824DB5|nr:hypothetical protein [Amycolatopsis nigrescens]